MHVQSVSTRRTHYARVVWQFSGQHLHGRVRVHDVVAAHVAVPAGGEQFGAVTAEAHCPDGPSVLLELLQHAAVG